MISLRHLTANEEAHDITVKARDTAGPRAALTKRTDMIGRNEVVAGEELRARKELASQQPAAGSGEALVAREKPTALLSRQNDLLGFNYPVKGCDYSQTPVYGTKGQINDVPTCLSFKLAAPAKAICQVKASLCLTPCVTRRPVLTLLSLSFPSRAAPRSVSQLMVRRAIACLSVSSLRVRCCLMPPTLSLSRLLLRKHYRRQRLHCLHQVWQLVRSGAARPRGGHGGPRDTRPPGSGRGQ